MMRSSNACVTRSRLCPAGTNVQPLALIDKYYADHEQARRVLLAHSRQVAGLAARVAEGMARSGPVDMDFVYEAALLHDIGMIFTDAPQLGCHGDQPYITHGVLGAGLLREEGLPRHALVCERHIGVGLSIDDIAEQGLPLPMRDMRPQSLEEEIVAYADLFYSKTQKGVRTAERVRRSLAQYGTHKVTIFNAWHERFERPGDAA